jgi:hypothetical protein
LDCRWRRLTPEALTSLSSNQTQSANNIQLEDRTRFVREEQLKQNHKTYLSRVLAIVCFTAIYLISSACNLYAQQQDSSSSISGTVVDSKGALVRDAAVIVKNQTTGAVSQANADNAGHFAVTGITSGRYTLIVNAKGFASATQEDVQASAHPAEISITLAIGSLAQSVEVQANNSIASQHALSQGSLDA